MGPVVDVPSVAELHAPPGVHHHDVVAVLGHHAQVVSDHHHGCVELVLQPVDEVQDLGLHGHVEGSSGLVRDQEVGVEGQGHGDHGALPHPPGELVRIRTGPPLGLRDAHQLQEVHGLLEPLLLRGLPVRLEHLGDLVAHPMNGIESRQGVLEDHADLRPPDVAHLLGRKLQEVLPPEQRLARYARLLPGDQAHHREEADALPRAGLAHHAKRLARGHGERDPVHGLDQPVFRGEMDLEVLDLQDRLGHRAPRPIRRALIRPPRSCRAGPARPGARHPGSSRTAR